MSQYRFEDGDKLIITGCDTRLKYVFMSVHDKNMDTVYSNMMEPNCFDIQDIGYFISITKELGIDFPKDIAKIIEKEMLDALS